MYSFYSISLVYLCLCSILGPTIADGPRRLRQIDYNNTVVFNSTTSKKGFITSPLYPSTSQTQENRLYTFYGRPDERVQIIFADFDLYKLSPNEKCGPKNSFLSYKQGPWNTSVFICGPRPLQILSEWSEFVLNYTIPGHFSAKEEFRGFNASYKFITNFGVNSGKQTHPGLCEFSYDSMDAQSGSIDSPNFPGFYPRSFVCTFIFIFHQEKFLKLSFTKFNLFSGSNENCASNKGDKMLLISEHDYNTPIKYESSYTQYFCGKKNPLLFIFNASHVPVSIQLSASMYKFNDSDFNKPELFVGFQANFEFMNDSGMMDQPEFCREMSVSSNRINEWLIEANSIIWVVGILGNIVNLVVFRLNNMAHPINLIFWWLSISDLLELGIIASYELYGTGRCSAAQIFIFGWLCSDAYACILMVARVYLFQVIHTITIGLNIMLVFWQYKVVANTLKNQRSPLKDRSIKLAVICIYIQSFILYLPFWYVHEIRELPVRLPSGHSFQVMIRGGSLFEPYFVRDSFSEIYLLVYGVVLRIGPLIILIVLCTLLFLEMKKVHHNRQSMGMDAYQLSKLQRNMNRINATIVIVMTMFLITEVPFAISTLLLLNRTSSACSDILYCTILLPFVLLNCSYNIFCYLIRIKEYRKTLKMLLTKIFLVNFKIYIVLFIAVPLILLHFILKTMNNAISRNYVAIIPEHLM